MKKLWGGGDEYENERPSQGSEFQWLKGLLYKMWNYRIGLKFGIPFDGPKTKDEFVNQAFFINSSGFICIINVLWKLNILFFRQNIQNTAKILK